MIEVRNFQFLFYGFSAAWLIVVIYILYLGRREKKIRDELARLKNIVGDTETRR